MNHQCPKCQGTGSLHKDKDYEYLDCPACDAAEKRTALARWVSLHCQHMTREQRDWAIYQHATELAQTKEDAE